MHPLLRSPFFRYSGYIGAAVLLITLLYPGSVRNILSTGSFLPHATCYLQDPRIIWLHVTTDSAIGLAYVSIALTLSYLIFRASKDIPFNWAFLAFGTFIISCGFTHFMEVWTVWEPVYWLSGYVKGITAVASVVTAVTLFPLLPKVFQSIAAVKAAEERRVQLESALQQLSEAHRGLGKQKAELEAANRDLEMFAHSIAHDLRAPNRAIVGFCKILQDEHRAELSAPGQALVAKVMLASKRSEALLSDLLQYTSVSRAGVDLQSLSLDKVVQEALEMIDSERIAKRGLIHVETGTTQVRASSTLLLQVLTNLIGNALKYVPPDVRPEVKIAAVTQGGQVRISVQDNGIGIPESQHEKIFGMFVRLHSHDTYGGSGIGLAIVRRAVERMGGKVGLDSAHGQGSTFWIELPAA